MGDRRGADGGGEADVGREALEEARRGGAAAEKLQLNRRSAQAERRNSDTCLSSRDTCLSMDRSRRFPGEKWRRALTHITTECPPYTTTLDLDAHTTIPRSPR